jgi:DNA-binding protein YbaB
LWCRAWTSITIIDRGHSGGQLRAGRLRRFSSCFACFGLREDELGSGPGLAPVSKYSDCPAYAAQVNTFDAGAFAGQLRAAAEGLRDASDQVQRATQEAQAEVVKLSDENGLAEVEVDGRPRIRTVRLSFAALHDADNLDRLLTDLLNHALAQARSATQTAVLAALPPSVRRDAEEER